MKIPGELPERAGTNDPGYNDRGRSNGPSHNREGQGAYSLQVLVGEIVVAGWAVARRWAVEFVGERDNDRDGPGDRAEHLARG